MTKTGHQIVGLSGALVAFTLGFPLEAIGFFIGSNAPDTLEMSYKKSGMIGDMPWHYGRVFEHRTLTHWWLLWVLALVAVVVMAPRYHYPVTLLSYQADLAIIGSALLTGYLLGGLGHLLADSATPMGIPIATPYGRRFSFKLYKTGATEWLVLLPIFAGSAFFSAWQLYIMHIV